MTDARVRAVSLLRRDDGSILPLTIFFAALCLVVVLLVAAVTSLYLERERLYALADGAALAGAESYDLDGAVLHDGHVRPALDASAVHQAVDDFLESGVSEGFEGLVVERAGTEDGHSATVRLAAVWHPPVVSLLVPAGVRIEVTSTARSVFW